MIFWRWTSGRFTLLEHGRFMLSFSLFMLLILTRCSCPSTSGMLTHDSTSGVSNYRQIIALFAESELWLSLCADWLRSIFYCYLLTLGKLTRWQKSQKRLTTKLENGFSIWIDHFPYCSWRTHFENTLVLERVRDSNISLSFAYVNATHFFLGLRISKKLRGKDIDKTFLIF